MTPGGVVPPGRGRQFSFLGNELTVKAGPESGFALVGVFESQMPPAGALVPAHVHEEYEEIFYVLDGEIEYRIGDDWTTAAAGSAACVPRGVIHAFRNASQHRPARHLVVHAPVAALALLEELGEATPDQFARLEPSIGLGSWRAERPRTGVVGPAAALGRILHGDAGRCWA